MDEPTEFTYEFNHKQTEFWLTLFNDDGTALRDAIWTEIAYWGGWGCGKTSSILLALNHICQLYPGCVCVVIRDTYDQLDDTVITDLHTIFKKKPYKFMEQKKEARYPNGSIIRFRAFDQPEKILGGNIDVVVVSQAEQIPRDLFITLFGRMRGPGTIPRKLIITEGNPSEGWAKERYIDNPLPAKCYFIPSTTLDNEKALNKINPDYISNLLHTLTPGEIRRNLYGEWGNFDEMVFANFAERVNIIDPFDIPASYRKAIGGDYGFRNPASFVWGCTDYDRNIVIFDEFYESGKTVPELASASFRHGVLPIVYDFSAKRPDRDGKSVWSELETHGLYLIPANKDERRNISIANALFKLPRLYIMRNCVNLIKEIRKYRWKKLQLRGERAASEEPVDKDNHAIDAMLYLLAYLENLESTKPEVIPYEKTLKYHTEQHEDRKLINYG